MNKRSYPHPRQQQTYRKYSSWILVFGLCAFSLVAPIRAQEGSVRDYRIDAIRYATFPDFRTSIFIGTASEDERIDAAGVIWLIRGNNKTIFVRALRISMYSLSE